MLRIEEFQKAFPDFPEGGTAQKLWEMVWNAGVKAAIKQLEIYTVMDAPIQKAYVANLIDEIRSIE